MRTFWTVLVAILWKRVVWLIESFFAYIWIVLKLKWSRIIDKRKYSNAICVFYLVVNFCVRFFIIIIILFTFLIHFSWIFSLILFRFHFFPFPCFSFRFPFLFTFSFHVLSDSVFFLHFLFLCCFFWSFFSSTERSGNFAESQSTSECQSSHREPTPWLDKLASFCKWRIRPYLDLLYSPFIT